MSGKLPAVLLVDDNGVARAESNLRERGPRCACGNPIPTRISTECRSAQVTLLLRDSAVVTGCSAEGEGARPSRIGHSNRVFETGARGWALSSSGEMVWCFHSIRP